MPDVVDEPREQRTGQPGQGCLMGVGRTDLERGDAQAVATFLGQVHDETVVLQYVQQVIDRRARQAEVSGDAGGRQRTRVPGQVGQHLQGLVRRGHLGAHR